MAIVGDISLCPFARRAQSFQGSAPSHRPSPYRPFAGLLIAVLLCGERIACICCGGTAAEPRLSVAIIPLVEPAATNSQHWPLTLTCMLGRYLRDAPSLRV